MNPHPQGPLAGALAAVGLLAGMLQAGALRSEGAPRIMPGSLDGKPGIIAVRLNQKMGLAYDRPGAGLLLVWDGWLLPEDSGSTRSISLPQGPMPAAASVPRPASASAEKPLRIAGTLYHTRLSASPWTVEKGGKRIPITARLLGISMEDQEPMVRYALRLPDGAEISIREYPQFDDHYGAGSLFRNFIFAGIPAGMSVRLDMRARPVAVHRDAGGREVVEAGVEYHVQESDGSARLKASWGESGWGADYR